ncbi:MAG: hypothetical protein HZA52_13075 [Planctomycetes bacterium]|nr:hypothetical protein [Planctomycetota bacterium]
MNFAVPSCRAAAAHILVAVMLAVVAAAQSLPTARARTPLSDSAVGLGEDSAPGASDAATLYFRSAGRALVGAWVSNSRGELRMRTDLLGRIVQPPQGWTIAGARLQVWLDGGEVFDVVVELDPAGVPLPFEIPDESPAGALTYWFEKLLEHVWAAGILTVGVALAAWFGARAKLRRGNAVAGNRG